MPTVQCKQHACTIGKMKTWCKNENVFFIKTEEPEEVFKIKRSSHSRRVAKQLKKQSQQEKDHEKEMKAKKKELVCRISFLVICLQQ